jgi:histidine triad (HIT) family protein
MPSIFSRIASGEIPSCKVAESADYYAFLDINPLAVGHTLVIPREETDYLFDMDDQKYQGLFLFAKKVARAIESEVKCKRIGVAVVGLEVPHAHIHLIPLNDIYDIDFSKPKLKLSAEELTQLAEKIAEAFEKMN